ncbi:DUF2269 family protein [Pseudoduganella plicata]|jgi:uncharacterized membrane protein|uniref:DUF2269 domain-containing protein n=1 Tax=Pseudoduganella plicata TaxID=321984 RepID=A0A4P7BFM0_9BURK|nr:DUF2269 domain-containing protein [Pseudoduganella plicata]QBQ37556.1 DUF2269 domain-containing protein [Pseudoduganella plicata]GGY91273.1 membrane protein [Pseudoduganella plicata]
MEYVIVKWLHILSSTFLFGTGIGSAWYLLFAVISRNVAAIAVVTRIVVIADWLFTGTTMIAQPATGFYLIHLAGYPMHSAWIMYSIGLFVLAALCWFPVVWLQMRLRDLSAAAASAGTPLPPAFWRYFKGWIILGIPAFFAFLGVFYLMVAKPM